MQSKRFLSHLILTLSWCLKYNIKSQWEKLASSYNSFFRVDQIIILATTRIARNTTRFSPRNGEKHCPRRNQRQAAQAVWVRCEPSTPRRDPRTGEPARSSRRRAQPFLPSHCRSERNWACLPSPLWSLNRVGATHSVQAARWARTLNCSRSPNLAHNSSGSGPPPSCLAAHWEGSKRSPPLVPDIILSGTVKGHWAQEGYEEPYGILRQTVFGHRPTSTFGLKARKNPTRLSSPHHVPRQGSAQVCESFSESVALQIGHIQIPIACTLNADLSTDHRPSTFPV